VGRKGAALVLTQQCSQHLTLTVDFDDVALTLGASDADLDVRDLGGSALPASNTNIHPKLQLVLVLEGTWVGLEADGTLQASNKSRSAHAVLRLLASTFPMVKHKKAGARCRQNGRRASKFCQPQPPTLFLMLAQ
jgi:hypothetical protein